MKNLLVEIVFKVLIGACLYSHDPAVSAAYGLYLIYRLWEALRVKQSQQAMKESLEALGYRQEAPGVYVPSNPGRQSESVKTALKAFDGGKKDDEPVH